MIGQWHVFNELLKIHRILMKIRIKMLAAVMVAVIFQMVTASAATTQGTMTANETWSGTVTLTGDVTVPENVTLTITPGTRVESVSRLDMKAGGVNASRIELIIDGGVLKADGVEGNPILFSVKTTSPPILIGDWYGIRIRNSANANSSMSHCIVEYAKEGLRLEGGTPSLRNCIFRTNAIAGLSLMDDTKISATGCSFEGNDRGIGYYNNVMLALTNCNIIGNTNGILPLGPNKDYTSMSSYTISECNISSNMMSGLFLKQKDAKSMINKCQIAYNGYIILDGNFVRTYFDYDYRFLGINASLVLYGNVIINKCTIQNNLGGIQCGSSSVFDPERNCSIYDSVIDGSDILIDRQLYATNCIFLGSKTEKIPVITSTGSKTELLSCKLIGGGGDPNYSGDSGLGLSAVWELVLKDSIIQDNLGGGIRAYYGPLIISGCKIINNGSREGIQISPGSTVVKLSIHNNSLPSGCFWKNKS